MCDSTVDLHNQEQVCERLAAIEAVLGLFTGFVGPQGPQGEQGPPGEDGLPGADGADGVDGSDATVTAGAIETALGAKPALQSQTLNLEGHIPIYDSSGKLISGSSLSHLSGETYTSKLRVGSGPAIAGATAQVNGALVIGDGAGGVASSLSHKLNFRPRTQTISGGEITYTAFYQVVDTEGQVGTDDLHTINGGTVGDVVLLRTYTGSRDVTVKHFTSGGNIILQSTFGDVVLNSSNDSLLLIYNGSHWVEFGGVR